MIPNIVSLVIILSFNPNLPLSTDHYTHHVLTFWPFLNVFITFENWANVFPYGDGACAVELTQSQLHVEEWYTPKYSHEGVGDEESS